ncbi:MAG TPA: DUF2959 family protein [Verrucomicrobiota bacterium]|nr:DUF2959 family protein [Verrucomicrobiota bacterium]
MKTMKKHLFLALGLATLLATATQASQQQLASSITEAQAEAGRTLHQLKATLNSLTALTKQKKGDLRPAYDAFAAEVPKTQAAAGWTKTRVQWMDSDGKSYFDNWQKTIDEIASKSLQKKAQKRLDAVRKNYDKARESMAEASEKFAPFLSDLNDIQKLLSQDVTPAGVKAISSTVSDANWRYKAVHRAVSDSLEEMGKMSKSLSSEKE